MITDSKHILRLLEKEKRVDGRGLEEYRNISVQANPLVKPEGCALVKLGKTELMAGVKMDICEPFPDKPKEGVLMTTAEFSPVSSPQFEPGPPREKAVELARVVDRGIRESGAIDTKKLCLEEGEEVWRVFLDIHILNHSGNLADASALAGIISLLNAKMPEYDGKTVNYEKKTKKLPVKDKPVAVSFAKIGDRVMVDPNLDEENVMDAGLIVTVEENGNICSLQKLGSAGLTEEELNQLIERGIEKAKELRKFTDKKRSEKLLQLPQY